MEKEKTKLKIYEEELTPVLTLSKLLLVPTALGLLFFVLGGVVVGVLQFLIFMGLGVLDYKDGRNQDK